MRFEILARDAGARRGRLETARGVIDTPGFMPVGTLGAVLVEAHPTVLIDDAGIGHAGWLHLDCIVP